jgi:Cd2+/Zn2+-exporting ATPase
MDQNKSNMTLKSPQVKYYVDGMDCANCALTLERSLSQVDGVDSVQVNFTTTSLEISGDFDMRDLTGRVEALGYHLLDESQLQSEAEDYQPISSGVAGFFQFLLSERQTTLIVVSAILLLLSVPFSLIDTQWADYLKTALQVAVIVIAGYPIVIKGIRSLIVGKQITIDLLMSIATIGALLIGETGEAATVILLFAIGEGLEGYTAERARDSLRSLLALKPDEANVLSPCMDCEEHMGQDGYNGGPCPFCGQHMTTMPVDQISVGEIVVIRPGERIPVDGSITSGSSTVNQAPVTGESLPVNKSPGDEVFAGTLNGYGALEVRVTSPAEDSTISRIVNLVEEAQSQRAPVERFIDRFARYYTPAVVLLALCLAVIPPLLFDAPFLDQPDGTRGWLYRSLALLIIACPCALVISTPVTVVSSLTGLARRGVLVKGGVFLDMLSRIKVFAFDKTGTLTRGHPIVTTAWTMDCPPDQMRCDSCDDMLALAASVESRSEHPLAQAIMNETHVRQLVHAYPSANAVQALTGLGVQGITGGAKVTLGSHTLFHGRYQNCEELHDKVIDAEANGETVVLVGKDEYILGYISIADVPRPTSQKALQALKAIDPDIHTVMLTGDNHIVAEHIANRIGEIDEVRAGLLPEDKMSAVDDLQTEHGPLSMVGDGVNDAPALAASTVGIAMGGAGTAQAMETADVVLMKDDLTRLPDVVNTSHRTQQVIWQNIIFSLAIKGIFLLLTLPGITTLWMAVFADMGASLLVTLNGIRMLSPKE